MREDNPTDRVKDAKIEALTSAMEELRREKMDLQLLTVILINKLGGEVLVTETEMVASRRATVNVAPSLVPDGSRVVKFWIGEEES